MWLMSVGDRRVVSANILLFPKAKPGDSMSDRLNAMRDTRRLMAVMARSLGESADRDTIAVAARRRTKHSVGPPRPSDTRLVMSEGHCLDSRSSSDLTSGGDLSKAHPNYQTPTRG